MHSLFDKHALGGARILNNRVVMAPMTRTRTSDGDVPNALMARYYGQRASAGLIITEATDVSPRSKGYAWTPGIYSEPQIEGWRLVTDKVHREGGEIFLQLWHVGRMAHVSMLPNGEAPWGVTDQLASQSDVFARGSDGEMTFIRASAPRQIATAEIPTVVEEFAAAARNATQAGFDGVEIHGANGYLLDQFMNSTLNTRADAYGGRTPQNRARLLLEVVDAAIGEMGAGNVGVRVSPFGRFNNMPSDPRAKETLLYLSEELSRRHAAYLHLVYQLMPSGNLEGNEFRQENLSDDLMRKVRGTFRGTIIWAGGFDESNYQAALESGLADMIAFGRPFIANPDLVARLRNGWPLVEADHSTFYTRRGEVGYTDFPGFTPAVAACPA
jgi:N-ethylmaleimide reductase